MIIVVQGARIAEHPKAIESMFQDRKRLFVDLLGWSVPVVDGRFEKDRFDCNDATYLIAVDDAGHHIGSMRLLPTNSAHILGDLFPSLCDHEVPRGPATFEITRLCLPARFPATERLSIRNKLISAMVDHARSNGIEVLTGVVQESFLDKILAMGWKAEMLGTSKRLNGTLLGAFRIEIDHDTPALLAANDIYSPKTIAKQTGARGPQPESCRVMKQDVDRWAAELEANGYCIIENAIDVKTIDALNHDLDRHFDATPFCDGDFYGRRTKRFGGLLKRSQYAEALVRHPLALALSTQALGPACDRIGLNLTQAIEIHPGAPLQYPHRDQDMWQGVKGAHEYLVNVMWPLSPFRTNNGATILWPGSHRRQHEEVLAESASIAAEMDPGSLLLFLGSTLHGGGANRSNDVRRGLIVSYCLGWLKPFENQWLVYPPDIARSFDPELASLVGYVQHRPNLGNVEGQCPSLLLHSNQRGQPAATDALRPDQAEALRQFVAGGSKL